MFKSFATVLFGLPLVCFLVSGCAERGEAISSSDTSSNSESGGIQPTGKVEVVKSSKDTSSSKEPPYPVPEGMVWIPGGVFEMGCSVKDGGMPDEGPVHVVELDGFYMDKTEVTNAQFLKFVEATGYVTLPEGKPELRSIKPGFEVPKIPQDGKMNLPGSVCLNPKLDKANFDPKKGAYNWWDYLPGADWRHPEGPESSIKDRMDHPVVHISWLDVQEYCKWAGKKLPTEAQWEFAARGGLDSQTYPWGSTRNPDGKWLHNIWQGEFPVENTEEDGFRTTAPVGNFPANNYGLHDMSGNVWEFVQDYYQPDYYFHSPRKNPPGPDSSFDPQEPHIIKRVQRGGSFMCSDSYCIAYRCSARMKAEQDTGAFHTGFRCIVTPEMLKKRQEQKTAQR